MQDLGITPKRSLGQNFLIQPLIVDRILYELEQQSPNYVIEIGPGLGVLTEGLISREIPHMLIELDRKFAELWRVRGENIIEMDALKVHWNELNLPKGTWLLGNLPYQIGSRLVIDLSQGPGEIFGLMFMFQKEVAQRLTAKESTKEYGFLSVIAQTFWDINKVIDASPEDFYPSPKVSSRVVKFKRREVDENIDEKYIAFVKKAFQHRRKFMMKSFSDHQEKISRAFTKLNIKATSRAEELTPEKFQNLYTAFCSGADR